jgi:hypothetical protein
METPSSLKERVSLDSRGGLLIDGKRASNEELKALLSGNEESTATPEKPEVRLAGFGEGPPSTERRAQAWGEFSARCGFVGLGVSILAAVSHVAISAYLKASLVRDFSQLNQRFQLPGEVTAAQSSTTRNPIVVAVFAATVVAVVLGALVLALRWWWNRANSVEALGVSTVFALGGVFVFGSPLLEWTQYLKYASASRVLSEALQQQTTWASLLGLASCLFAVMFFVLGIKATINRKEQLPGDGEGVNA